MAVRPFTKAQQEIRCNFTSKWGNGSLNPSSFPTKSDVSYIPLYPYVSHPTVLQRHIKSNSVFKKSSLQRKEVRRQTDFTGKSSCNLFNFLPSKSASWFSLPHHSEFYVISDHRVASSQTCGQCERRPLQWLWNWRSYSRHAWLSPSLLQGEPWEMAPTKWPQKNGAWNLQKSDKSTRNNDILWYYGLATKKCRQLTQFNQQK